MGAIILCETARNLHDWKCRTELCRTTHIFGRAAEDWFLSELCEVVKGAAPHQRPTCPSGWYLTTACTDDLNHLHAPAFGLPQSFHDGMENCCSHPDSASRCYCLPTKVWYGEAKHQPLQLQRLRKKLTLEGTNAANLRRTGFTDWGIWKGSGKTMCGSMEENWWACWCPVKSCKRMFGYLQGEVQRVVVFWRQLTELEESEQFPGVYLLWKKIDVF